MSIAEQNANNCIFNTTKPLIKLKYAARPIHYSIGERISFTDTSKQCPWLEFGKTLWLSLCLLCYFVFLYENNIKAVSRITD